MLPPGTVERLACSCGLWRENAGEGTTLRH
jgi:hypothetical protein